MVNDEWGMVRDSAGVVGYETRNPCRACRPRGGAGDARDYPFDYAFERAKDGAFPGGHVYTRNSNPNRGALERALAALEGGGVAVAFASGNSATSAVLQALASGDHVIASTDAAQPAAPLGRAGASRRPDR